MRRGVSGSLRAALVLTLVCAALLPASAHAEKTIALNTGTFELSLTPGQQAADRVLVANNGDEPLKALVYTADISTDEQGEQTYVRPDVSQQNYQSSSASWIRLRVPDTTKLVANTPYLELDPGEELPVDFELVVPNNAAPGDYNAVIFFEMFEFDPGQEGAVSKVSGRIGARIDLRVVGEVEDDLGMSDFSARTFVIGDTTPFSLRVTNAGNIDKRFSLALRLVGEGETEVWNQVLDTDVNIYAGKDRYYDGAIAFDGVGFGRYTLRADMDYDREMGDEERTLIPETESVERTVWVLPLWLVILVIVLIGVPVLYVTYRVTRKRSGADRDSGRSRAPRSSGRGRDRREAERERRRAEFAEDEGPVRDEPDQWAPDWAGDDPDGEGPTAAPPYR